MSRKNKKKTTFGGILRNIILIAAICVFLFSAYQLVNIYLEYKKGTDEYDKIREYVKEPEAGKEDKKDEPKAKEEEEKKEEQIGPQIDFAGLKQINPDIVGWIQMEALDVSYPIVKGTDNDHYLHYTFEGQQNAAGAIFMEHTNNSNFEDCNTIIYGHNMKNGSMFGTFRTLHEPENLTSPYLWICLPDKSYRYEIFTVHTTSATGDTYTLFSAPDDQFAQYLKKMRDASEFEVGTEPTKDDKIVTLSTCTGNDATRFVIQARRLPEVYK